VPTPVRATGKGDPGATMPRGRCLRRRLPPDRRGIPFLLREKNGVALGDNKMGRGLLGLAVKRGK